MAEDANDRRLVPCFHCANNLYCPLAGTDHGLRTVDDVHEPLVHRPLAHTVAALRNVLDAIPDGRLDTMPAYQRRFVEALRRAIADYDAAQLGPHVFAYVAGMMTWGLHMEAHTAGDKRVVALLAREAGLAIAPELLPDQTPPTHEDKRAVATKLERMADESEARSMLLAVADWLRRGGEIAVDGPGR